MELDLNSQDYSGQNRDWQALVLNKDFIQRIDQIAAKRFGTGALAEEAATYCLEYLSSDNWARCESYEGKAKITTFLYTLVANAVEEFSRKKFGRPRPPTWLKNLGDTWVKLWRSLCLERQLLPSIVDRFSDNDFRDKQCVEGAARLIKQRIPDCGLAIKDAETQDDVDFFIDSNNSHCDQQQRDQHFIDQLGLLIHHLFDAKSLNTRDLNSEKLRRLREALQLNDEQRIMLRMVYVDGLSKSACSRALGLPAHQVGRKLNTLLEQLNQVFSDCHVQL
jgi:RNA polymerase sigma factor (sigma-70 family)